MFGIMVAPKQVLYQMEKGDIVDSLTVIRFRDHYPLLQGPDDMRLSENPKDPDQTDDPEDQNQSDNPSSNQPPAQGRFPPLPGEGADQRPYREKFDTSLPCRRWAFGRCTYGTRCRFRHDVIRRETTLSSKASTSAMYDVDDAWPMHH